MPSAMLWLPHVRTCLPAIRGSAQLGLHTSHRASCHALLESAHVVAQFAALLVCCSSNILWQHVVLAARQRCCADGARAAGDASAAGGGAGAAGGRGPDGCAARHAWGRPERPARPAPGPAQLAAGAWPGARMGSRQCSCLQGCLFMSRLWCLPRYFKQESGVCFPTASTRQMPGAWRSLVCWGMERRVGTAISIQPATDHSVPVRPALRLRLMHRGEPRRAWMAARRRGCRRCASGTPSPLWSSC